MKFLFFILTEFVNFTQYILFLFKIVLHFLKYRFRKKFKTIIVKLLVQLPGKISSMICNDVTKMYPKFVSFRLFFQIKKKLQKQKIIEKFYMDSDESVNLFKRKGIGYLIIFWSFIFFLQIF